MKEDLDDATDWSTIGGRLRWAIGRLPKAGRERGLRLFQRRLEQRSRERAKASKRGGDIPGTTLPSIGTYLRKQDPRTPTVDFLTEASALLRVRREWLTYGSGHPTGKFRHRDPDRNRDPNHIRPHLRGASGRSVWWCGVALQARRPTYSLDQCRSRTLQLRALSPDPHWRRHRSIRGFGRFSEACRTGHACTARPDCSPHRVRPRLRGHSHGGAGRNRGAHCLCRARHPAGGSR